MKLYCIIFPKICRTITMLMNKLSFIHAKTIPAGNGLQINLCDDNKSGVYKMIDQRDI